VRRRGEDVKAGAVLIEAGTMLDGGALALLATAGCVEPLVSPGLRVVHFTTGDEIVSPDETPKPGQIRDSNSHLIRGLLEQAGCTVRHWHLPEDFTQAKAAIAGADVALDEADVLLVSGGASVGDKDFTRPLLESLGYQISVSQVNLRPGKPLLFGTNGNKIAFGLPGNPLSHFVCFHAFVSVALARLSGRETAPFRVAKLAEPLLDAHCARETLWPAQLVWGEQGARLQPLPWSSSGDVTCLAAANALIRVPARHERFEAGTLMEFLSAG
jgi:molybdopterin molybdotransferase